MAEPPELISCSFIVKIWMEELASPGRPARWRGYITAVPSGERHYVQDLQAITDFIAMRLEALGVPPGRTARVRLQLRRWKTALRARWSRWGAIE